ncbi:MAG: hypothetical protein ABFC63_10800 [Thermoguttaceae bacterium]
MVVVEQETEVKQAAELLLSQQPDWVTFYREILGPKGVVRQLFPSREALAAFEQSPTYQEILRTLSDLRQHELTLDEDSEPTRVITVRLPKSMHEALRAEAYDRHTSMNKLCISKLLQFIEEDLVPCD